MPAFSTTLHVLVQGFYSVFWIAIVLDVGSPSLDLRRLPAWTTGEVIVVGLLLITLALVIGTMMHTLSRHMFRKNKDVWSAEVLLSPGVRDRYGRLGLTSSLTDLCGTSLDDLEASLPSAAPAQPPTQ